MLSRLYQSCQKRAESAWSACVSQPGDYDAVISLAEHDIKGGQQRLSMETMMSHFNDTTGTKQSRHKLKECLKKSFGHQLVFLQAENNVPQVVISIECLHNRILSRSSPCIEQFIIK